MMRALITTFVLVFAAIPLQADDKKKGDAKSDGKRIQGNWKLVERHRNGKVQKEFDRDVIVKFTKDEMIIKFGDRELKLKYKLDPGKKPRNLDQTIKREGKTRTRKSIYLLEGNTLKICSSRRGAKRPAKFESKEGDNQTISVFKRVTDKTK